MRWVYGVTTVSLRLGNLLPHTLNSLKNSGFDSPYLFVDGMTGKHDFSFDCEGMTFREPKVGAFGNWILALWELYIRNPIANRFALFQDDIMTVKNLRSYLESSPLPERGYLNLYTVPENKKLATGEGWFKSNQMGRGALGLIFDREGVLALLKSESIVNKPMDASRGTKNLDGAIQTALCAKMKFIEWCHNPSLVQHRGEGLSTLGSPTHRISDCFWGEEWDAMTMKK